MELGLGLLGLAPLVFWALTPREFEAALRGRFGTSAGRESEALSRADLDALMRQFPDEGAR